MLRVGLTGDLGSGKSTVAALLAAHGARVVSSDDMARAMMQPGRPAFDAIVAAFGPTVLAPDGTLDRRALAALAFDPATPRIEELNAILHPAVLAEQARLLAGLATRDPHAIAIVESALIFTTRHAGPTPWTTRFDAIVLVTAPEDQKLARFVARTSAGRDLTPAERAALEADALRRLALQHQNAAHEADCILLPNDGSQDQLKQRVDQLWTHLRALESRQPTAA